MSVEPLTPEQARAAIASASIVTRFWAVGQPSYHFGLSVALSVIPLAIGASTFGRRR